MTTTKLTPTRKTNEREIEMMVGKATCAYANYLWDSKADANDPLFRHVSQDVMVTSCFSEYEATVRCLDMFVRETIYSIQKYIMAEAEKMVAEAQ